MILQYILFTYKKSFKYNNIILKYYISIKITLIYCLQIIYTADVIF